MHRTDRFLERNDTSSIKKKEDLKDNRHDCKHSKIDSKHLPPSTRGGVRTSTKQSMDYVTINSIAQRINYTSDKFPEFILKELMDNALDFLINSNTGNYYWSIPDTRRIIWVNVKQEVITILHHHDHQGQDEEEEREEQQEVLRITVRNSNELNIVPFPNLPAVFDMNTFDSTKRHQRRISGGALGDALKEILAIPYALISGTDDGSTFTRKQWEIPLILRFRREEYRVYLRVNKADDKSPISTHVDGPYQLTDSSSNNNYIEVEVTIPVLPAILGSRECLVKNLEQFYKKYILFRTKEVEFHFNESEGKNSTSTKVVQEDKSE